MVGKQRLRAPLFALGAILLLALFSRLWELGDRPAAHDECLFACYGYWLAVGHGYDYDPILHGPLLLEAEAVVFKLLGSGKFTMRLFPALCGVLLIAALLLYRPWLGWPGVLAAMLLILCSPTILFYSRFLRNDLPFLLATALTIGCVGRAFGRREAGFIVPALACLALMACIKENTVFVLAALGAYGVTLLFLDLFRAGDEPTANAPAPVSAGRRARWTVAITALFWATIFALDQLFIAPIAAKSTSADEAGALKIFDQVLFLFIAIGVSALALSFAVQFVLARKHRGEWWNATGAYVKARRYWIGAGVCAALLLLILAFSVFLTKPASLIGLARDTVAYWWEEHDTQRLKGPYYFYWPLLLIYELPVLAIALGGLAAGAWARRTPILIGVPLNILLLLLLRIGGGTPVEGSFAWEPYDWLARLLAAAHLDTFANLALALSVFFWSVWLSVEALLARRRFRAFLLVWLGSSILCYSYAGEKVPWLVVHITLPAILLAADMSRRAWEWLGERTQLRPLRIMAAAAFGVLAGWNGFVALRTCHAQTDWPREPLIYNHTTRQCEELAEQILLCAQRAEDAGTTPPFRAAVFGNAVWPLVWYLRDREDVYWDDVEEGKQFWLAIHDPDDVPTSISVAMPGVESWPQPISLRVHWEFEDVEWRWSPSNAKDAAGAPPALAERLQNYALYYAERTWGYTRYYFLRRNPGVRTYDEEQRRTLFMLRVDPTAPFAPPFTVPPNAMY